MKKVYFTDKEYERMLKTLGDLSEKLHEIESEETKEMITSLMEHFDVIHRESISRLWGFVKYKHPELAEELNKDYTIHHLLALYDLENFEGIEQALDPSAFVSSDDLKIMSDQ